MPANLTPDYKAAEQAFRRSTEPEDRLHWLNEMMRTIPKHKGTEHLRADIKTRIKDLTDQIARSKKGGARGGPPTVFRPEGAAQVVLIGPPNSGKSALHTTLTGSHSASEPYPFATQYPVPGMMPYEDVAFQLIDVPSISPKHPIRWVANTVQPADAALLVVDLSVAGCLQQVLDVQEFLASRKVHLTDWKTNEDTDELFALRLPTAIVVAKVDLLDDLDEQIDAFCELTGLCFPILRTSVLTGEGLDTIGPFLFQHLQIVRVYTKVPGKPPDMTRPYTVRAGATIADVAALVHRDMAAGLRYARLWGGGNFEGRHVGRDHEVMDGDIVELHA